MNYVEDKGNSLISLIKNLNGNEAWRAIYGPVSLRLKDQELILRFLSLKFPSKKYSRPLRGYLDDFASDFKQPKSDAADAFRQSFIVTVEAIYSAIGKKAFRPQSALNAAVFDAVMVGVAERLATGSELSAGALKAAYESLLGDPDFKDSISRSTADEDRVADRMKLSIDKFAQA